MNTKKISGKTEIFLLILALFLGILAAAAGYPDRSSSRIPEWIELNKVNGQEIRTVDILDLAGWIMEKKDHYLLYDLREEDKYQAYHIPTAGKFEPEQLGTDTSIQVLVIVYTEDGSILPEKWKKFYGVFGEKLHLLSGGLRKWAGQVLFPDLTGKSRLTENEIEKRKQISFYFGGRPKLPARLQKNQGLIYLREGC